MKQNMQIRSYVCQKDKKMNVSQHQEVICELWNSYEISYNGSQHQEITS